MSSVVYNYFNDFTVITGSMKLEDNTINKFKVAKEFSEKKRINSIDFSHDGKQLVTSSDDDTIVIYDCEKGISKRDILSKKYGADLIRFTHANNTAIHTSTKENDTIRYLSLHDNKYLRYFVGHEKRVVTLSMSPADDTFMSGSLDQTVRLWDLRQEKSTGKLPVPGFPVANYDPEGLIFAIGYNAETIKLYDQRMHDKGPFSTIKRSKPANLNLTWRALNFSPDGKQILITTDCEELYILDAFSGQCLHTLAIGPKLPAPLQYPCEASYTPDSQYILSGSIDGCIHVWSTNSAQKIAVLRPERANADAVQCVKFNPKFMLMASACSKMSFWIPTVDDY